MGYSLAGERAESVIEAGSRTLLAQEIRNARGGHYTFMVKVTGVSSAPDEFEKTFLPNFVCRLLLFRFRDTKKDPRVVEELASVEFRPLFGKTETFKVARFLGSTVPGVNFPIGNGLGVAVAVEKKTPGRLTIPGKSRHRCALQIHSVSLDFSPAPRDENDLL
jgi:ribosomal protein S6